MTLYEPRLRSASPDEVDYEWFAIAKDEARYERVSHSRRALLFAAFAAEAYANDFLYARWEGQEREALRWRPTVDKYVELSQLTGASVPLTRGAEPIQTPRWLFARRDELVHAAPRGEDLTYKPENHNPRDVARCIVAVADAASRLINDVHSKSVLKYVLTERQAILNYGMQAAGALPSFRDAPSEVDLLRNARRRTES